MRRSVGDLMTKDVVTVRESMPFKDLVDLMFEKGISAVPVVDADLHLVGIVSEADLLPKQGHPGYGAERHRMEIGRNRVEHGKAAGTVAADVMTTPAVSIGPDATPGAAARLMRDLVVKRLPVVDTTGAVIGIISRKDILGIFLRPDPEIRDEVVRDLIERKLWVTPEEANIEVSVENGIVTYRGTIDRKSMLDIIVGLTYGIEGVVGVRNRMRFKEDDTRIRGHNMLPRNGVHSSAGRPYVY